MTSEDIRQVISECCNDVLFVYNGLQSGVTSRVYASVPIFQLWHGTDVKECSSVDEAMNLKFFSGQSIIDIIGSVDFSFA